jgi:hypothetical protein
VAPGSHSSRGVREDATLASELSKLEREARRERARSDGKYSRSLLAEVSGVPEATFARWMAGDPVPGGDDGDLMAVVSILALWAGQPMPEPRAWLRLAAATRRRPDASVWRRIGGLLKKPAGRIAAAVGTVITGVATAVVIQLLTTSHNGQPPAAGTAPSVPFGYTVSRANGPVSECVGWLFPQPIQKIRYTSLQGSQNAAADEAWALRNGASDVNGGAYTITLQGNSAAENVAIRDVRIKVLSRNPARPGTVIYNGVGCGGGLTAEVFTVQVDSAGLQFVAQNGATKWPYTISGTDIEYLILDAQISKSDRDRYQFVYQIDWSQGSRQGTVTVVAPNGKPFTAVPVLPGSNEYYDADGHWAR